MEVRKDEFPVVVQAYDTSNQSEVFIAEQVVNSQADIENFTSRYSGKLIKARSLTDVEYKNQPAAEKKRRSSAGTTWVWVLLVIVILVAIGYATGWIQRTFNIDV